MQRHHFVKLLALATPMTAFAMELNTFEKITDKLALSERMPALFVGHGNPMNALYDNPFTQTLSKWGKALRNKQKPKAIMVVSAHWLTKGTFVNNVPKPETIHDFGGFPKELFDMQYPAPGSPEFAKLTASLQPSLIHEADDWGIDHGTWTILHHLFPDADIPVYQLSIDYSKPMEYHFNLAAELKSLRDKGVLIIGSGNVVHNLGMSMRAFQTGDPKPFDWAVEFDEYAKKKIEERDWFALFNYENTKAGKLSSPSMDHYAPMIYTLGLSYANEPITQLYEEVSFGAISMRTFSVG